MRNSIISKYSSCLITHFFQRRLNCWKRVENASSVILCSSSSDFCIISSLDFSFGNKKFRRGQIRLVWGLMMVIFCKKVANNTCRISGNIHHYAKSSVFSLEHFCRYINRHFGTSYLRNLMGKISCLLIIIRNAKYL